MKQERSTSAMIEAALMALIVTVIVLTIGYIPLIGSLIILMPALFASVWIRRGRHYGILSAFVASIITLILGFPAESFAILAYGGVIGGFLGEGFRNNLKASQTIILGAVGSAFGLILIFSFAELVTGIGLTQIFAEAIEQTREIINTYNADPALAPEMNRQLELMTTQMQNMLPYYIIVLAVVISALNHSVVRKGLKRIRYEVPEAGLFRDFALPRNVFIGSMIMMLMAWLTGILGIGNSELLFLNILLVVTLVFSIQGAAVAIFFMYHYKFPRSAVVAFTVGGILFYSMLQFPLFVLGMLETVINLRERMKLKA